MDTADHAESPAIVVNGEALVLRGIRRDDVDRLRAAYARLSPDSQRLRFFTRMPELPLPMAERLCDVDMVRRAAFVLVDGDGAIRGVGRYECDDEGTAEIAVTVEDAFQGQGLGTLLMRRLGAHARANGISHLTAEVLGENRRMLDLLRHAGRDLHVEYRSGVASVLFHPVA